MRMHMSAPIVARRDLPHPDVRELAPAARVQPAVEGSPPRRDGVAVRRYVACVARGEREEHELGTWQA